jgi:hypothetical protein
MISFIRQRLDKDLTAAVQVLKVAEKAAEAIQVPYLTGILGLAVHIAETAQVSVRPPSSSLLPLTG